MRLSRYLVPVLVAMVVFPLALPLPASEPSTADVPLVDQQVRELMQDRNYPEAIAAIDRAAQAEGAPRDYLAYLKGRAL